MRKEVAIKCDNCDNALSTLEQNVVKVRVTLKGRGWSYVDGKDYCAECTKKSDKNKGRPSL